MMLSVTCCTRPRRPSRTHAHVPLTRNARMRIALTACHVDAFERLSEVLHCSSTSAARRNAIKA